MASRKRSTVPAADKLLDQAIELVVVELEKRVRTVLRRGGRAKSFCMAMGSACFYDKDRSPIDEGYPYPKWCAPVFELISEFDRYLYLTGIPLRIDGDGKPTRHNW